jgi:hypothetical protein
MDLSLQVVIFLNSGWDAASRENYGVRHSLAALSPMESYRLATQLANSFVLISFQNTLEGGVPVRKKLRETQFLPGAGALTRSRRRRHRRSLRLRNRLHLKSRNRRNCAGRKSWRCWRGLTCSSGR